MIAKTVNKILKWMDYKKIIEDNDNEYTKWEHVLYQEDFRAGAKVYEIMKRTNILTNENSYKKIYISECSHDLMPILNESNRGYHK